jgi:hypothetical protein
VAAAAAWLLLRPSTGGAPEGGPDGPLAADGAEAPASADGTAAARASLAKTDPTRAARARGGGAAPGARGLVGLGRRGG